MDIYTYIRTMYIYVCVCVCVRASISMIVFLYGVFNNKYAKKRMFLIKIIISNTKFKWEYSHNGKRAFILLKDYIQKYSLEGNGI